MGRRLGRLEQLTAALVCVAALIGAAALDTVDARAAGTGSISGVVTGPDNAGVADVVVAASPFDGSPADNVSTTTDAAGHYRITGLGTGDYRVTFADPGFGVAYYPGTPDIAAASRVAVVDGVDTAGKDQHFTATGEIRGTVTSEGGGAIAGAAVMVTARRGGGGGSSITAADGSYAVTGLADGTYTVRVSAAGHLSVDHPTDVTVSRGGVVSGIDVVLPVAGVISGRVSAPDGKPAVGVLVSAVSGDLTVPTATASDGTYSIDTLPTGVYAVSFTIEGESAPVEYYDDAADLSGATPVSVAAGVAASGIDAVLGPDPSLGGTVRKAGDGPLAGATVTVMPAAGAPYTATTDGDGRYLFGRLPDGTYTVSFSAPGYLAHTAAAPVKLVKHHPVFGVDALLHPAASIAGAVTALDGTPIAGATIEVRDESGAGATATSDAGGNYLVGSLAAGNYVVQFSAPGYIDQSVPAVLHMGKQLVGVDARLDPGATITGTFLDANGGAPAGDLTVVACPVPTVPVIAGCVDEHGTARPPAGQAGPASPGVATRVALPPGLYNVAGTDGVIVSAQAPVTAVSGGRIVCTFSFTGSGASASCDDGINEAPVAVDDKADVVEGFGPATIDVLANDTDPDGDPLHIVSTTGAAEGTVECSSPSCTYLPRPDLALGPDGAYDRFGYTVSDGVQSDPATVNVNVSANATTIEGDHGLHRVDMTAVLESRERADQSVLIVYCVRAATAGWRDVSLGCAHAHVPPGADRTSLPVWVKGDRRDEGDEYAIVDVRAYGGTVWDRHLTLVIRDDDAGHGHHPHHGRY